MMLVESRRYRPGLCPLALFCLLPLATGRADDDLVGSRVKISGRWTGEWLEVASLRKWDPKKDETRGNVTGVIDSIDAAAKTMRIGPFEVIWDDATKLEDLTLPDLKPGTAIEATGRRIGRRRIQAFQLEPEDASPGYLSLAGTIASAGQEPGPSGALLLLDVPIRVPRTAYTRARELARDPDDLRPDDQLQVPIFGRMLAVSGEISNSLRADVSRELESGAEDDTVSLGQELKLELFYPATDSLWLFLKGKALYEGDVYSADGDREFEHSIECDEHWLYWSDIFGSPFSLQVGRQRFREDRRWWWDEDLDAVRLHYDTFSAHGELGVAEELWKDRFEAGGIEPESKGVFRVLGQFSWSRTRDLSLGAFSVLQVDHSGQNGVGQRTRESQEDETDGQLVWLGGRMDGRFPIADFDSIDYHLTTAFLAGNEVRARYQSASEGTSQVAERHRQEAFAVAFDSAASWTAPLALRPSFSLGYAFGSGDRDPERGTDNTFRQTGLQENRARHRGVVRFRYYGEVLQPELSNLHVATGGVGLPLFRSSSIDIVYHAYSQATAAGEVAGSRIKADPEGRAQFLGHEVDLILGIQEWQQFEIRLAGGVFVAGKAYGANEGEASLGLSLKFDYSF